jgi:hypothetical protein
MSKRTDGQFERRERDFYGTPLTPILRLLPHLDGVDTFAEPMCGDGAIVLPLEARGWECVFAMDMEPQGPMIGRADTWDVSDTEEAHFTGVDEIISNPPWPMNAKLRPKGKPGGWPTIGIVLHLIQFRPAWMLMAADFMHNVYYQEHLERYCTKIVSVGRVKWIADSDNTGFDNAAWYRFDMAADGGPTEFVGNTGKAVKDIYHPDIEGVL